MHFPGRSRSRTVAMTEGNIYRRIFFFALPLLIGNLFQQLYNMVDTWVVGNFVSSAAFSAVGTVAPIINMLIGLFMGLSNGAGVVISQYFGAGNERKVSQTVHTAITMTLLLSIAFTIVGVGMTPTMLHFMNTPEDVFPEAQRYLTIYFGGITGLLVYNMGAGILQAVGDSQRPFYFLVLTALINTVLDLVLVLKFGMGVEGVAYATIIAQAISAILVTAVLLTSDGWISLRITKLRIHWSVLGKIIRVGIPAAIQLAITAFSNVFVQAYINFFGTACMGGWTAYLKIDALVFMPMQSIALAATTFVGQNLGCGQIKRAKDGIRVSMILACASTITISLLVIAAAVPLVQFFNRDPEVVTFGSLFLRLLTPFYLLCCANQVISGGLRGAGNSRTPMIIMLCSFVLFRQCYLFVMANFISNTVIPIAMGYPAGWFVCSLSVSLYYLIKGFGGKMLIEQTNN